MRQALIRTFFTVTGLAGALLIGGCSSDLDQLQTDIDKALQRPGGRIQPLPEVMPYVSHEYQMA